MGAGQIRAGKAFVEVGGDSAPLSAALARVKAKLSAFGMGLAQLGGSFATAGVGILGAVAWPLKLAANMETTKAGFTALLKDAGKAGTVLKQLQQFAASTPFEFPELAEAARSLLAFGITADQLIPTLKAVGDVSSAINAPIGEIAEIYGKARTQGRLFMEDINQLTGRGIPIIGELAKQFGVSEDKVRGLVEQGKVSFDNLQRAFAAMTTGVGQFAGQMDAKSKTALGKWSTLKDTIGQAVQPIGDALLPAVGRILDTLSTMAAVIGQFIKQNADLAGYVAAGAVGFVALGAALSAAGFALMGVTSAIGFASSLFTAFTASVGAVIGALLSLLAPLGVVGTVGVAGVVLLLRNFHELGGVLQRAGGTLWQMAGMFGPISRAGESVAKTFGRIFGSLLGNFGQVRGEVQSGAGLLTQFAGLFEPITRAGQSVSVMFTNLFGTITAGWQGVLDALSAGNPAAALDVVFATIELAWAQTLTGMLSAWANLTGSLRDAWQDAITFLTKLGVNGFTNLLVAWQSVTTFMSQAFDTVGTYIVGVLDWLLTRIANLSMYIGRLFGMTQEEIDRTNAKLEAETQQRADGRADALKKANAFRAAESQKAIAGMQNRAAAYFNQLDAMGNEAKNGWAEGGPGIAAAEQRVKAAQERLRALNEANAAAAEKARATPGQKELTTAATAAASAAKQTSAGSFNAMAARSLGANQAVDRTAKATERTAKATETLVDRADRRKLVFG